jgi:hypothetical protein
VSSKTETGKAKKEMQKAAMINRTAGFVQRLRDGDISMISVLVCFVFVVILFLVDMSLVN